MRKSFTVKNTSFFIRKTLLCTFLFSVLVAPVWAQKQFQKQKAYPKGSIVTDSNKVISCYIKETDLRKNPVVSYMLTTKDTKVLKMKPSQYYRVTIGKTTYEHVRENASSKGKVLLLLEDGPIRLYAQSNSKGNTSYGAMNTDYSGIIETDNSTSAAAYETYLLKKDSTSLVVLRRVNYKDILKEMLEGYPGLGDKLEQKEFVYKSMPALIKAYNEWAKTVQH